MAANRITRGGVARRGLLAAALCLLLGTVLAACGSGGDTTTTVQDKAADAGVLNGVAGREIAAIEAYGRVLPKLRGAGLAEARRFRAQEQEHLDAVVKALRGLGEGEEPAEETIEVPALGSRADALDFLYELESVSLAAELRAISALTTPWPRSLLGSIVANRAQHLVLLRRALGAAPAELVPEAFEDGSAPAPGEAPEN